MPALSSARGSFVLGLARLYNEKVMGLLAILALATAVGPMVFDVGPDVERALTIVEWLLVTAFAAEFIVQAIVAPDRRAWLKSPWRLVDIVTILGPVVALLPQVTDYARGSLTLRMLRLGRAVAFGTRAGAVAVRQSTSIGELTGATAPTVRYVGASGEVEADRYDWTAFLEWTANMRDGWIHASNVDRARFYEVARVAGLPEQDIEAALDTHGHARLRQLGDCTGILMELPSVSDAGFPAVRRDRLLAIVSTDGVLTATTAPLDLHAALLGQLGAISLTYAPESFPSRVVCALLTRVRVLNQTCAQRFEEEVHSLEALEGGRAFLQETFRLRKEISTRALDLWHFKRVLQTLAGGKATLAGVTLKDEKFLDDLLGDVESLYENVDKGKEEVKALIEHHINFKSFEMNTFLRLLAVVSFLGLIPSVVGGLLGMNVLGNPWPITLGQVAFGIAMGMAVSLYVFAVKGWLR